MSQREIELTKESTEEATDLLDEEIPIIILPDGVDFASNAEEPAAAANLEIPEALVELIATPPSEPAPATKPVAASRKTQAPAPKPAIRKLERPRRSPSPASAGRRGADEPILALENIEAEIDQELLADQAGAARKVFSMPWAFRLLACGVASLLVLVLTIGWEYYTTSLALRPLHYFHWLLRPSGTLGLSLGVTGAATMIASLLYLLRKSQLSWQKLGSLQSWMGFHILTGLLGPVIALFHAAFIPTSALGLLAVSSMLLVVASGIVGRYIAVYFPHSLEGHELKFEEIRGRLVVYRKKLSELGVDPTLLRIDLPGARGRTPWLVTSFLRVLSGDWQSRREFKRLKEIVSSKGSIHIQTELVLFLIKRLCWERQWLVRYGEFRRLINSWRFLHRWLAIVLFVAIFFHVVVASRFGNLWILGGRK